jgi:hypothetical protein
MFEGTESPSPLAAGTALSECDSAAKSDIGRAIRTTPNNDTYAAICSMRVNGSLIRKLQAQQASDGARNVMTVASASGRYNNESVEVSGMFATCRKTRSTMDRTRAAA